MDSTALSATFENLTELSTLPTDTTPYRVLDQGTLLTPTEPQVDTARQPLTTGLFNTGSPPYPSIPPSSHLLRKEVMSNAWREIGLAATDAGNPFSQGPLSPLFHDFSFADFSKDNTLPDSGLAFSVEHVPMDVHNLDVGDLQSPFMVMTPFRDRESNPQAPPNLSDIPRSERTNSDSGDDLSLCENAFRQSFWLYNPGQGDHWQGKTSELSPSLNGMISDCVPRRLEQNIFTPVRSSTRYHILDLFLSISTELGNKRILSSFPSVETLNYLLLKDLEHRRDEIDSWIHWPTFDPNTASPELVIGLVISGALRCERAIFWRLGLALLEVHRQLNTQLVCPIFSF